MVAIGIVERDLANETTAPDEKATDGPEEDGDDEESGQNGLGCQNRLPCLESLLFEGGICKITLHISTNR